MEWMGQATWKREGGEREGGEREGEGGEREGGEREGQQDKEVCRKSFRSQTWMPCQLSHESVQAWSCRRELSRRVFCLEAHTDSVSLSPRFDCAM